MYGQAVAETIRMLVNSGLVSSGIILKSLDLQSRLSQYDSLHHSQSLKNFGMANVLPLKVGLS